MLSCSVMSDSLRPRGLQLTRVLCPRGFSRQEYGVGCHALLQGIFPTQGSNPGLMHCRQILYLLSHQESPRILEWVAYPFSSGSSRPRNQTGVSCIAGGFLQREACKLQLEKSPHAGTKTQHSPKYQSISRLLIIPDTM